MYRRIVTSVVPASLNVFVTSFTNASKFSRIPLVQSVLRYSTNDPSNRSTSKGTGWNRTFQPFPVNGRPMQISVPRPEEAEECYEFLLQHFFPVTPLRQIHRWDESEENRNPTWKLDQIREYFSQPWSVLARDPDSGNKIVSFVMSKMINRPVSTGAEKGIEKEKDRSPGWIARALISQLSKDLDFFAMCQTDRIFYICTWVVDPNIARSGLSFHIGTSMMRAADEDEGVGVTKCEAFSKFTENAMVKFDFKIQRRFKYDDFEVDGQKPLAGIPELVDHDGASVGFWLSKRHMNAVNAHILSKV